MSNPLHLTDAERQHMVVTVAEALDTAFRIAGFKPKLTSLFRTREEGEALGSKPTSAHEKGLAADMARPMGADEAIMLAFALGAAGFQRLEIADRHLHCDMDPTKPSPLIWKGVSK